MTEKLPFHNKGWLALALLFFAFAGESHAQSAHIDSLRRQLTQKLPDTTRAMVLERLGVAFRVPVRSDEVYFGSPAKCATDFGAYFFVVFPALEVVFELFTYSASRNRVLIRRILSGLSALWGQTGFDFVNGFLGAGREAFLSGVNVDRLGSLQYLGPGSLSHPKKLGFEQTFDGVGESLSIG